MTNVALSQNQKQPVSIYFVLVGGVMAVSFGAIFIRYAQAEGMPSILIACARLLIAAILITPITLQKHRQEIIELSRNDWFLAACSGLFLALHFALWVKSLEYTTVLISVTLVTTTPIWTALLEWFMLKSKLNQWLILGLIITIIGGGVIGLPNKNMVPALPSGNQPVLGATLALLGAIAIAGYLIIGRRLRVTLALLPYIWIVYGIAGLTLAFVVMIQQIPIVGYSSIGYLCLLGAATIPQLIGHSSMNYAVKFVSATYVSLASKLEPIGSALIAYFAFSEIPGRWQIIGSVIIMMGVIFASLGRKNPQKN